MQNVLVRWVVSLVVIVVMVAGMAVLFQQKQERPISLSKGTYEGAQDTPLNKKTVDDLRQRTQEYGNIGL